MLLNGFDIISTKILLDGQQHKEINPVMDFLIKNLGFYPAMFVKLFIITWLGILIIRFFKKGDLTRIKFVAALMFFANVYYAVLMGLFNLRFLIV